LAFFSKTISTENQSAGLTALISQVRDLAERVNQVRSWTSARVSLAEAKSDEKFLNIEVYLKTREFPKTVQSEAEAKVLKYTERETALMKALNESDTLKAVP